MFCIYLSTNSDLCHLQHKLIGFYNRDKKCLQRGTDWVFNLLAPELFFLILAHPVYKMWIIQEPNMLELWNKLHFEEKETESI